jgi:4-hydroxy-tetrahydrodipicolinate reductase
MDKSLKIALIGYGKMGKEIEQAAIERGHKIQTIITRNSNDSKAQLKSCDVAIEFTEPDAAVENIKTCIGAGTPIVVGTTGWYRHYEKVKEFVTEHKGGILTATNFSIGVNIFFHINKQLASLINKYPAYKATIEEVHHKEKLDAPSGTAITTAEGIIQNNDQYDTFHCIEQDKEEEIKDNELAIFSYRRDNIPGVHSVTWFSKIDEIELKHTANSRKGFALGSVIAAEWLHDRKGIFTMNDVLGIKETNQK